jgi:cytochrome b561
VSASVRDALAGAGAAADVSASTGARARYTRTAQGLHWAMAVLLSGLLALGFYMHDLPLSARKLELYSWHKWAGVTAFLLAVVRLAWLASHRPPALPSGTSPVVRTVSRVVHAALYALMLAIPLSGWLMSSAKGFQTVWFGLVPLPDLVARDAALGESLATVHAGLNVLLLALAGAHVAAALKHHFIDRDGLLARMWPVATAEEIR